MFQRVFIDDLVLFTEHIASAVRAGVPLHQTVELLAGEMVGRSFRATLVDIAGELRAGSNLADAVARHPKVFPDYFIRVLRAGEEGGALPDSLQQLAELIQKNYVVGRKVRKVFAYPVALVFFLSAFMFFYGTYIMPQIANIYEELGAELPASFLFLIRFHYTAFSVTLLIIAVVFWFARRFARVGWSGLMFDWFDLECPFLGNFTRQALASRLTRTLGTLLRAGVPLPEAISLCGGMLNNKRAQASVETVRRSVERGETLSTSMITETLFPPTMIWMLSAAEVKGDFLATLDHLADFYAARVENTVLWTIEILEPLMILVVGGLMVILATALYTPVFNLVSAFGL
ncbi:MAG: type II secretion system F family protein [Candidatus Omnitrophica bacterium]|nr:type II secretion system F family protein [Candidatus Omnitrophota bacterium]